MPNALSKKFDLIVVGAGVGGLILSLLMARKGFRVAVLDQQAHPMPLPRGEILQPNGLNILAQLGLLEALLKSDVHFNKKVHFHQSSGAHLCTIDYMRLPLPYPYSVVLLPAILQEILLDALAASPRIETFWGTSFKGLIKKDNCIVGLEAMQAESPVTFECSIVAGADGAGSRVRAAFQVAHRTHAYEDGYITMVVDRPPGFQEDSRYYLGKGTIFGAFPVSDTKVYLFYMIPTHQIAAVKNRGIDDLKLAIFSLNPEIEIMFGGPLQAVSGWEQTAYMRCFRVRCDQWAVDGGVLLGDAAHAMNPHVAQGRNSAMADAVLLADVLEDCFQQGDFSQNKLRRYEQARRVEIEKLQSLGDEMVFFWNSTSPVLLWLRDRVFKKVERKPHLHDKLLKTVAGIDVSPFNLIDRLSAVCL